MTTVSVCPSTVVDAPVDRIWDLLTHPEDLRLWADATLVAAEPPGPAAPGQELHLVTRALGRTFTVGMSVREVDSVRRRVRYLVRLPFGLVNDEVVTLAPADGGRTVVRFG